MLAPSRVLEWEFRLRAESIHGGYFLAKEISAQNSLVLIAVSTLWLVVPVAAQEARATLTGRITDPSGAVMPGVKLEAAHAETAVASASTSNAEGLYQISCLLPGAYTVKAESAGFKTLIRGGIELRIGDRVELNLTMAVGGTGEKIEVQGQTPLLETASASMGQVTDRRRLSELPLLHGNPMAVLELTPGLAQVRTSNLGLWGGRPFDNSWTE